MKRYDPILTHAEYSGEPEGVMRQYDDGEYVKAEVAQALYDALVRFINASESPNEEIEGQLHLSTRVARRALSLADGETE